MTLLRIPRLSNVDNVVQYTDTSLNSEITVIEALAEAANKIGRVHKIILMVDLGDLREGVLQENVLGTVAQIAGLHGAFLIGLGTNMGCFGGVLPSENNLGDLVKLSRAVERYLGHKLEIISGGGTSTLLLVENDTVPAGINQLRVGEGILLGTDTTNNRNIPWLRQDAFLLRAEVIEVKDKPSVPVGEIGKDAFGNVPEFEQGLIPAWPEVLSARIRHRARVRYLRGCLLLDYFLLHRRMWRRGYFSFFARHQGPCFGLCEIPKF
jgi:predicted amino acid racemase